MFCAYGGVRIAALRACVPAREIRLEDEAEYYGHNLKKIERIKKLAGFGKRRVVPYGITASDLCHEAADALLRETGVQRGEIDFLIFASQTPDYEMPSTACILQDRLGLSRDCAAFDLGQGCSGYVYALWLGAALVAGGARKGLVLAGEARPQGYDARNRIIAPVFGDSGSATLLVRDDMAGRIYFNLGTDGSGHDAIIIPGGKARLPYLRDPELNRELFTDVPGRDGTPWRLNELYMDGGAIFKFSTTVVPDLVAGTLQKWNIPANTINYLILHQANRQIMETIAQKSGFLPEQTPMESFSLYGNLLGNSIPVALCEKFGSGERSGRLLLCGYGVGLSWGVCVTDIGTWSCAPVRELDLPENPPSRQDTIEKWKKRLSQ